MFEDVYSEILSAVSETPELLNPLRLLEDIQTKETEFRNIQKEIGSLYAESLNPDESDNYKEVANDMLKNITDGRFEDFLKSRPKIDGTGVSYSDIKKQIETVEAELKKLKENLKTHGRLQDNLLDVVKKKYTDENTTEILDKCNDAITRLKCNFANVDVHENLVKFTRRDIHLEENIKKLSSYIVDLNQVIESRRTINKLEKEKEEGTPLMDPSSHLISAISGLLMDVQSANYSAMYEK